MTKGWFRALTLGLLLQIAALSCHAASASLRDDAQLMALLRESPQCCVIDARSAPSRKNAELAGALVYRDGLRINATSVVVVVADTDARALAVARTIAGSVAHDVYAVKGGYEAWQSVEVRMQAEASRPGSKYTFVIPFNTCQQDTPLHVFEAKPSRPAKSASK
jgi:3-mercaptopyruvate sulfurtransferase SseA